MASITVKLDFKRDTGRYLVADRTGREYWFDKQKLGGWSIDRDAVEIQIEEEAWTRRLRAERAEPEVVVHKTRICLCCRKAFGAERTMYVCDPCKQTANWQDGLTIFSQ